MVIPVRAHPVDTFNNVAGSQKHTGKNKLLDAVGVGAGRVEDHDSLLCVLIDRDIIYTSARTGNRKRLLCQFHPVHGSTADQNAVCLLQIVSQLILIGEFTESFFRNIIQTGVFKHIFPVSFLILPVIITVFPTNHMRKRTCHAGRCAAFTVYVQIKILSLTNGLDVPVF